MAYRKRGYKAPAGRARRRAVKRPYVSRRRPARKSASQTVRIVLEHASPRIAADPVSGLVPGLNGKLEQTRGKSRF